MLSEKPLSFCEIFDSLEFDIGHLNYQIKNLGDIITHTEDGKYVYAHTLSAGLAPLELLGKVEEQDATTKAKHVKEGARGYFNLTFQV